MEGTSPSRASRCAATGNEVPRWDVAAGRTLTTRRCGRFLGLPIGVVHVFVRGSTASCPALHQAGQAGWTHHPPARLSDEECAQGLASGVRATPRLASGLYA